MKTKTIDIAPVARIEKTKKIVDQFDLHTLKANVTESKSKIKGNVKLSDAKTILQIQNEIVFPQNTYDAFIEYYNMGFGVIPLIRGRKTPAIEWKNFQYVRIPFKYAESLFLSSENIGISVGKPSKRLFVIDCDSEEAFNALLKNLENGGLAKWVVKSGRGGHFWFLSHDCFVKNATLKDIDILGEKKYVVAPPSVHGKTGFIYTWIRKNGTLPPKLDYDQIRKYFPFASVIPNSDYPVVAYQVLIEGDTTKHEGDNSEAEFAAVVSFVRRGWSDAMIVKAFEHYTPPHFIKRNEDASWLKKYMIDYARRSYEPKRDLELINKLIAWANQLQWKGKAGSTDKRVFLACLNRAKFDNENEFRATNREIADAAAVELKTVRKSVGRLVTKKFLEYASKTRLGTYLRIPKKLQHNPNVLGCIINGVNQLSLQRHDVWRIGGLGASSLEIFTVLQNSNKHLTPNEISIRTGKHISTIYKKLPVLVDYGIIAKDKGKYLANFVETEYLDGLAERVGLLGKSEAKKETYEEQKSKYAWFRSK